MSRVGLCLLATIMLMCAPRARAMSVLPPTFTQLVHESGRVVRGQVMNVEVFRDTTPDGHTVIKTRVTWKVARCLKGSVGTTMSLDFLGGRIGTQALTVPGMPRFKVGDDDYVFVDPDETSFCPLLAAGHGRYHVQVDRQTGRSFVARENGVPMTDTAQVAESLDQPAALIAARHPVATALTPDAFEAAVLAVVNGSGGTQK